MRVILASGSPRRKDLMDLLEIDYEIIVSNAEEVLDEILPAEEQPKHLSYLKAKAVFDETSGDRIVIGSDTMVLKDGELYGKPKDRKDAVRMLKNLKNSKHQVCTGLAILVQQGEDYKEYIDSESIDVYISDMTDQEIEEWLATGHADDKAGAYAIQMEFMKFVERMDGSLSAEIGLPLNKVYNILKQYI